MDPAEARRRAGRADEGQAEVWADTAPTGPPLTRAAAMAGPRANADHMAHISDPRGWLAAVRRFLTDQQGPYSQPRPSRA
jgi:hypothetical protein